MKIVNDSIIALQLPCDDIAVPGKYDCPELWPETPQRTWIPLSLLKGDIEKCYVMSRIVQPKEENKMFRCRRREPGNSSSVTFGRYNLNEGVLHPCSI